MLRSQRLIYAFGGLFLVAAAGQASLRLTSGGAPLEAAIDFVLMSLPGVLMLYVGGWLSDNDLDPDLYPRIVGWTLGGVGVMLVFLVLRAVHPGVTTSFTFGTRAIALAIGSVAGLGIGIYEAAALTRERRIERHNEELTETRAELARRNRELTETRTELERAVEQLEASNERLDHFASTASHDLQEPLRMVSSYLQLLESRYADDLDDDAREFVDFAVDGAQRMQTMVADLLAYSRVDTGGKPFEEVDLDAVLDDVRRDLQVRIDETDARVTSESLPRVRGDASQLRQLFQNLLSNAIEYSGGPPRVHVSAERRAARDPSERRGSAAKDDGDAWVISVSDEGVGIDPADQGRIFEIFQRFHGTDEHAGSGIGLALCRRIVERHGGDIWVDSEPGAGSTFSFTVPAVVEPPIPANAE